MSPATALMCHAGIISIRADGFERSANVPPHQYFTVSEYFLVSVRLWDNPDGSPARQKPRTVVVSGTYPDGTLIETTFDQEKRQTALLVAKASAITRETEWEQDGTPIRPIKPTNNLIRHGAIRFASDAVEYGTVEKLLADIDRYISRYVSLPAEARNLAAGYVLLSWVYDVFNELPYLRFRGDYGTGKTRALLVIGSITYLPFFASGASTVSPIFHTLDAFRGTLVFDEADFRFSDEKAELVKILNNGNAKGFPVLRTRTVNC